MSKQTTKKIEKIEFGFQTLIDPGVDKAVAIEEKIYLLANKLNQIIDHINKEGKHEV